MKHIPRNSSCFCYCHSFETFRLSHFIAVKCYCEREKKTIYFYVHSRNGKMFGRVIAKLPPNNGVLKTIRPSVTAVRHGHHIHGKPVGVAKTIEQRLECKLSHCTCLRLGFLYRDAEMQFEIF